MNGSRKNREKVRKMGRSLRISENTPVETSRTDEMNTIWLGDEMPPKVASTTTTNVPDNIMVNYRATIVPDGKAEYSAQTVYDPNSVMTPKQAMKWLKKYAAVSGVPDLKEAVMVIADAIENCIIENMLD